MRCSLVVPALLVRLDYSFDNFAVDARSCSTLSLAALLAALPFLAGGIVIALAIKTWLPASSADLRVRPRRAGLGALAIVPLLWLVDAPTLVVGLGAVGASRRCFSRGSPRPLGRRSPPRSAPWRRRSWPLVHLLHLPYRPAAPSARAATPSVSAGPRSPASVGLPAWETKRRVTHPCAYDLSGRRSPPTDPEPLPGLALSSSSPPRASATRSPGPAALAGDRGRGGRDIYNALTSGQTSGRRDRAEPLRSATSSMRTSATILRLPLTFPRVAGIGDGRSTLAARDTPYDPIHIGFIEHAHGRLG